MNDKYLFLQMKAGNETAFNEIYKSYYKLMFMKAFYLIRNSDEAKDVVQDIFINLWEKKERIKLQSTLKSYLFAAVKHKSIDRMRHESVIKKFTIWLSARIEKKYDPNDPKYEIGNRLNNAFSVIRNTNCIECLWLQYVHKLNHYQVAERMHVTPGTVRNRVSKALKLLREQLKQNV